MPQGRPDAPSFHRDAPKTPQVFSIQTSETPQRRPKDARNKNEICLKISEKSISSLREYPGRDTYCLESNKVPIEKKNIK